MTNEDWNGPAAGGRWRARLRALWLEARTRRGRLVLAGVLSAGFLGTLGLWWNCGFRGCPDVDLLAGYVPGEASTVLDRDGQKVAELLRGQRVVVPLDSLPEYVPAAFIAIEDRKFFHHRGVDWPRVLGALWVNVRSLGIEQGFSTITMQLARNLFPDKLPARSKSLWRKLSEIRVAMAIEDEYTKEQILELYLNQIYFGNGAWGIEPASQSYFGKPARRLALAEVALLAALPQAPSRLNPRENPKAAVARRNLVLERMVEQGLITERAGADGRRGGAWLSKRTGRAPGERAAYFVAEVRRVLEEELGEALYTEGLVIHTTLDVDIQRVAEEELVRQLRSIEAGQYGAFRGARYGSARAEPDSAGDTPEYLQGAVILMEAGTGSVLALVGGRDFRDSEYNRATQARRQPGSAFKPFVYAAALAGGYPPTYRLEDTPFRHVGSDGRAWEPRNFESDYGGVVTLRNALVHSRNAATVRLAERIGVGRAIETAQRMGLRLRVDPVPSVVLGSAEVSPIAMTAAYAAFATLGDRPEPRYVRRVEEREGRVVWEQPVRREPVIERAVAFLVTSLLRAAVDEGTGSAVRAAGFRGPAAGKTGTTNDVSDAWFIGYTPDVVGTIWIGFDRRQPIVRAGSGGRLAAPAWGRIMRRIGLPARDWVRPPGVEEHWVDSYGLVVPPGCPAYGQVVREFFLAGTAPMGPCHSQPAYPGYDTLQPGYDTLHPGYDTLSAPPSPEEESWWSRFRGRVFGNEKEVPTPETPPEALPPDTSERILPPDTTRVEPTRPLLLGKPVRTPPRRGGRDTVSGPPADTMRTPG